MKRCCVCGGVEDEGREGKERGKEEGKIGRRGGVNV